MRRIPIQLDEKTYRALKLRAHREKRSIAAIVRESIARSSTAEPRRVTDFNFVATGVSRDDGDRVISENHDQALAAAYASRRARHK